MGTPRAKRTVRKTPASPLAVRRETPAARTARPIRPDSMLHAHDDRDAPVAVRPDTRTPVRPISVRHDATIGAKSV